MGAHTCALITLFHLPHDDLSDLWVSDYLDHIKEIDFAAKQLVLQLTEGGYCSPAFLIAVKRHITLALAEIDAERDGKTNFATAE